MCRFDLCAADGALLAVVEEDEERFDRGSRWPSISGFIEDLVKRVEREGHLGEGRGELIEGVFDRPVQLFVAPDGRRYTQADSWRRCSRRGATEGWSSKPSYGIWAPIGTGSGGVRARQSGMERIGREEIGVVGEGE